MRRIIPLLLLVLLVAGCGSGGAPAPTPSPTDPPEDPQDFFTGEPTAAVIDLQRMANAPRTALLALQTNEGDDEGEPEVEPTLIANVHLKRYSGRLVDFQRHYEVEVPHNAASVELPIEVPAEQDYEVTAFVYDPNIKSSEGNLILVELGVEQEIGIMAEHTNHIPVPVSEPEYEITAPDELYSGGDLVQIRIDFAPEHELRDGTTFWGLNPWEANGTPAFWSANGGHVGQGIPNTGWMSHESGLTVPYVDEPTTLYYQFRQCKRIELQDESPFVCAYIPDIDAGEPLFEITIYPEPEEL